MFLCENNNSELHVGKNHFQIKTEKIPFQKCSHGPLQPLGNALFWDKKFWKQNTAKTDFFFFFFSKQCLREKNGTFPLEETLVAK